MAKMTAPLTAAAWLTANCTPEDIISLGTLGMTRMDAFAAAKVREFAERAAGLVKHFPIGPELPHWELTIQRDKRIAKNIRNLAGKEGGE